MNKLEEAINTIQNAIRRAECADACGAIIHKADLNKMLSLLKTQEPRVMTLEEVEKAEVFWIEEKESGAIYAAIATAFYQNQSLSFVCRYSGEEEWKEMADYCVKWRPWTARPTDEQRKEVKWDG